jgi:hypothetical protein
MAAGSGIAVGGALMLATSTRSDGWSATISNDTPKTPPSPRRIARGLVERAGSEVDRAGVEVARTATEFACTGSEAACTGAVPVVRTDFLARSAGAGFFALFGFFAATGILLSESLWSFRSALST